MAVVQVQIPYVLAPHQAVVRNAIVAGLFRFFVLVCGRRSGKTLGAVYITVEYLTTHPDTVGWWVAPTFTLTRKGFREAIRFLRHGQRHLVASVNRSERRIEFTNGSFLEFRSAHDPDNQLVSEGLDWLVVDEAALIRNEDVWPQYLRPAVSDRKGRVLFITSPRGRNWLWKFWSRGQNEADPEVVSWRLSTEQAGFVDADELAAIKASTAQRIWDQEYRAEFLEGGGAVFRKVDEAVGPLAPPDNYTVLGVDLAKTRDWTVIWALNSNAETVEIDRFQQLDWSIQKPRIVGMYHRLKCRKVLVDVTGMHVGGDAVVRDLRRAGLVVEPITLSGPTKAAIVENLMMKFDNVAVRIPDDPVALEEIKDFTDFELPSGRTRYAAPEGEDKHDDTVVALALAAWGLRHLHGKPRPTRPAPGSPDEMFDRAVRKHGQRKSSWAA